jgi:hypothetical protein
MVIGSRKPRFSLMIDENVWIYLFSKEKVALVAARSVNNPIKG